MLAGQREGYLAHLAVERGLSDNTLAAYRRDLARYESFLAGKGVESLGLVERAHVADFAQAIGTGADGGRALAPASASRVVVAVRGWHRFAVQEGWSGDDPSLQVKPRAVPKRLPKAIATDQVAAIMEAASQGDGVAPLRDRALLELVYATGARISEAVGLDVDDVSLEPGAESALLRGKGRKERVVPLGTFAAEALNAYLVRARSGLAAHGAGVPALFLNARGARLSRQSAWAILRVASERAGVSDVSPHTLRHSFATHLLSGGADVRVVQELLGHASVTTTQVYTLVTRDSLREAYVLAHPRARE
ncbi:site-specific tyrosine recombinase XerD [Demequina capsici]|uniref:Tyrosine recombinase XerC n=1 Tax=Demequina capsici TaxID=3075620 RepID=A0AA96FFK1_9MICO|nr:site-specific tyrosine recombinase XerD [Demequina sp. PMTSA13]WNM28817.1 site-specific tyrosine recombinase XerD [Demequina sp. PMTSA13]